MSAFFNSIGSFFSAIGSFISTSIQWIGKLFGVIASSVTALIDLTSYLPADLLAIALCLILIAVIFLIVGR